MRKNIEDKRAYERKYKKERRDWLKAHHFCTECKKQDSYTLIGKRRCYECAAKHRKRKEEPEDKWTQITQKKTPGIPRSERTSYGLCYICGDPIADIRLSMSDKNTTLCAECYEQRAAHGRWLAEKNKQEFKGRHKTTEMIVRLGLWKNGTKPRG